MDLIADEMERNPDLLEEGPWGFIKGAARTAGGLLTMGDEAIATVMGDRRKGRFTRGAKSVMGGIGDTWKSVAGPGKQAVTQNKDGSVTIGGKNYVPQQAQQTQPQQTQPQQAQQTRPNPNFKVEGDKIKFQCPKGHAISAPTSENGKSTKCPSCEREGVSAKFQIPIIGDVAKRKAELGERKVKRGLARMEDGARQTERSAQFKQLVTQYAQTRDPKIHNTLMTNFPREFQAALIKAKGARGVDAARSQSETAGRRTRMLGGTT